MLRQIPLEKSWSLLLEEYFNSEAGVKLGNNLEEAYSTSKCYPPKDEIFAAFNCCPFQDVKVVIIGQDPYHGKGEAHGLAFSTMVDYLPPSLLNIYKAIKHDYPESTFSGGNLTCLANQGVLLVNSCLTVMEGKAMSHKKLGWQSLIDYVLKALVARGNVVFMLWGQHAQKLVGSARRQNVQLLQSVHPSPLSAYQGFFSCGHFKEANNFLESKGMTLIDWSVKPI